MEQDTELEAIYQQLDKVKGEKAENASMVKQIESLVERILKLDDARFTLALKKMKAICIEDDTLLRLPVKPPIGMDEIFGVRFLNGLAARLDRLIRSAGNDWKKQATLVGSLLQFCWVRTRARERADLCYKIYKYFVVRVPVPVPQKSADDETILNHALAFWQRFVSFTSGNFFYGDLFKVISERMPFRYASSNMASLACPMMNCIYQGTILLWVDSLAKLMIFFIHNYASSLEKSLTKSKSFGYICDPVHRCIQMLSEILAQIKPVTVGQIQDSEGNDFLLYLDKDTARKVEAYAAYQIKWLLEQFEVEESRLNLPRVFAAITCLNKSEFGNNSSFVRSFPFEGYRFLYRILDMVLKGGHSTKITEKCNVEVNKRVETEIIFTVCDIIGNVFVSFEPPWWKTRRSEVPFWNFLLQVYGVNMELTQRGGCFYPFVAQILEMDPSRTKFSLTDEAFSWIPRELKILPSISMAQVHEVWYKGATDLISAVCWYFAQDIDDSMAKSIGLFLKSALDPNHLENHRPMVRFAGIGNVVTTPSIRKICRSFPKLTHKLDLAELVKGLYRDCDILCCALYCANLARDEKTRLKFAETDATLSPVLVALYAIKGMSEQKTRLDFYKHWTKVSLIASINLTKGCRKTKEKLHQQGFLNSVIVILYIFQSDRDNAEYGLWALFNLCHGCAEANKALFERPDYMMVLKHIIEKWGHDERVAVRFFRVLSLVRQCSMDLHQKAMREFKRANVIQMVQGCAANRKVKNELLTMLYS